ncbi:MAG: HAMP domain-containing histidine kinase [Clostridiales bacterium]|nr:HAMP domain-containing histidine kinase [Clostridiales bacterium]
MNSEIISAKNYISTMSHELRAPINVIASSCQVASMYIDDKVKIEKCLDRINVASQHLTALVDNILSMAEISHEKLKPRAGSFSLESLISHLFAMAEPLAEERSIDFSTNAVNIMHGEIIGDYRGIMQILINLVSNAIKYTAPGGWVRLEITEIEPQTKTKAENSERSSITAYKFICSDNGIGMSKEFLDKIFEPFVRADNVMTGDVKGTGLGMSIVKNLVDMMGGKIKINSREDVGTTVTVDLEMVVKSTP